MFEVLIQVCCPHCEGTNIKKNGRKANGKQTYRCGDCSKQFQDCYDYRGADPKVKKQVIDMTLRASGIRDIGNVLNLAPSSVVDKIRRHARKIKEPDFQGHYDEVEIDEFWSFVNKRMEQKRWCWYVLDRATRKILAFHIGKRNTGSCKKLIQKVNHLSIGRFYSDDYKAYSKVLPAEKHIIGKEHTTHIERLNRDFRTHLKRLTRRTVCHSRDDEMHYQIIKMYINHRNNGCLST